MLLSKLFTYKINSFDTIIYNCLFNNNFITDLQLPYTKKNKLNTFKFFLKSTLSPYKIFRFIRRKYRKLPRNEIRHLKFTRNKKLLLLIIGLRIKSLSPLKLKKFFRKISLRRKKFWFSVKLIRGFFFKISLFNKFKDNYLFNYSKFKSIVNFKFKNKFKVKNLVFSSKVLDFKERSPYHLFNTIYFMNYGYFRNYNFNFIIRYNHNLNLYVFIKNNVTAIFKSGTFPKSYVSKLVDVFTFMCFTRTINVMSLYIKRLISRLGRLGQKNFYYSFNCIDYTQMVTFFKKLFIFGFFMKSTGKIAGYVGDRTKTFYVRFGNCSRSNKIFKYLYKQVVSNTKAGSIGSNMLFVFK